MDLWSNYAAQKQSETFASTYESLRATESLKNLVKGTDKTARFSKGRILLAEVTDGNKSCPDCFTERTHTLRCGHRSATSSGLSLGNRHRPALDRTPPFIGVLTARNNVQTRAKHMWLQRTSQDSCDVSHQINIMTVCAYFEEWVNSKCLTSSLVSSTCAAKVKTVTFIRQRCIRGFQLLQSVNTVFFPPLY